MTMPETATVRGDFDRDSLPNTLHYLAGNHPVGRLELLRGTRRAVLYLRAGRLVAAELEARSGEEVIAQLLTWVNGKFEFYREDFNEATIRPEARVGKPMMAVLLSAIAEHDQQLGQGQGSAPAVNISAESIPILEIPESGSTLQLDAGLWALMSKIDGARSVQEIAAALGAPLETVLGQLSQLSEARVLRVAVARPRPLPAGFMEAVGELMVHLMGPLGDMLVEDAVIAAKLDPDTITAADVPRLVSALETEVAAERRSAYRSGMARVLERFGL